MAQFSAPFVSGFGLVFLAFSFCLPRRRVRWLAAFATGQLLPPAEPLLASLPPPASFRRVFLPPVPPSLPARRSVDCLLFFCYVVSAASAVGASRPGCTGLRSSQACSSGSQACTASSETPKACASVSASRCASPLPLS